MTTRARRLKSKPSTVDALLTTLAAHAGRPVRASSVALMCRVTPNAVQQAAHRLRQRGYRIESSVGGHPPELWYALRDPDPFRPAPRGPYTTHTN